LAAIDSFNGPFVPGHPGPVATFRAVTYTPGAAINPVNGPFTTWKGPALMPPGPW
jgi:hypothetical protein